MEGKACRKCGRKEKMRNGCSTASPEQHRCSCLLEQLPSLRAKPGSYMHLMDLQVPGGRNMRLKRRLKRLRTNSGKDTVVCPVGPGEGFTFGSDPVVLTLKGMVLWMCHGSVHVLQFGEGTPHSHSHQHSANSFDNLGSILSIYVFIILYYFCKSFKTV